MSGKGHKYAYKHLSDGNSTVIDEEADLLADSRSHIHINSIWKILCVISLLGNLGLLAWSTLSKVKTVELSKFSPLHGKPLRSVQYRHLSSFSNEFGDHNATDQLWDNIKTYHGIVAIDSTWANDHSLQKTMRSLTDESKSLYVIDVYHQLHCLISIRKAFWMLHDKDTRPLHREISHYSHCFDAIRQSLMCTASDELLTTWGDGKSGDGDYRQCKDWKSLKDWATDHSACNSTDSRTQKLCTGGDDGLPDTIV